MTDACVSSFCFSLLSPSTLDGSSSAKQGDGHRNQDQHLRFREKSKKWKLKRCETWGWGRCPNSQAWRMPPQPLPRPRAPATHRAPREHAGTAVTELQGYYNKRTISVYTGEGERRVIAVAAPRVGSCLLTAFLNRRSSAALSISAPPRNPALDWPK